MMNAANAQVALITGSGRGIGRGIALALARDGYDIVLNSVSADPAQTAEGAYEVKTSIERDGGRAEVVRADISLPEGREAIEAFINEKFGRLDLLVNNAGVAPSKRQDILEASENSFDRLISINLKGPYFLTQRLARRMIEWQRQGLVKVPRIAFVTSISAYAASVNRGDYCLSKAALSMAVQLFASRLAEFGIPVVEIRPGIIATRMTSGVKEKYDTLIGDGLLPTHRWGLPEDVARVVSAFGRGDLDYSTGVNIDVSGGFNIRQL